MRIKDTKSKFLAWSLSLVIDTKKLAVAPRRRVSSNSQPLLVAIATRRRRRREGNILFSSYYSRCICLLYFPLPWVRPKRYFIFCLSSRRLLLLCLASKICVKTFSFRLDRLRFSGMGNRQRRSWHNCYFVVVCPNGS